MNGNMRNVAKVQRERLGEETRRLDQLGVYLKNHES